MVEMMVVEMVEMMVVEMMVVELLMMMYMAGVARRAGRCREA